MPFLTSKVTPSSHEEPKQEEIDKENNEIAKKKDVKMFVVLLHTLFKRYGGRRHPKIEPYEEFRDRGELYCGNTYPLIRKSSIYLMNGSGKSS